MKNHKTDKKKLENERSTGSTDKIDPMLRVRDRLSDMHASFYSAPFTLNLGWQRCTM
jgi:hypothetical protein